MIIINHRQNNVDNLAATPSEYGIEVDLRNHGDELIVVHDPFDNNAVTFEEWLRTYNHAFLIANVKEEGLEPKLVPLLEKHNVREYFILDESLPYIRKYALSGLSKFAVRVSEIESADTALTLVSHLQQQGSCIEWVWLDSFTGNPLPRQTLDNLKAAGLKLCQVSPELHHIGKPDRWEGLVEAFIEQWREKPTDYVDMVCTKLPALWHHYSK